jgi:2-oxoglutarate ferredoxin oxidoreductase subunit alpha
VGWGSTLGAIEEAVDHLRAEGRRVSSVHLRFLSPMEPGLREIFSRFGKVMTVEINYSDETGGPYIDSESRRYSQLAQLLRAQTLVDIDCWSRVPGSPLPPGVIEEQLRRRLTSVGVLTEPRLRGAAAGCEANIPPQTCMTKEI